jgi:hypothetical protein
MIFFFLQLKDDWEKNNKALSDKMRRMSKDLNEKSDSIQYTVFEAMQTIMDYIEESFENVMLPCTPGKVVVQSNLAIRNFLVALKLFLSAKCSLSL